MRVAVRTRPPAGREENETVALRLQESRKAIVAQQIVRQRGVLRRAQLVDPGHVGEVEHRGQRLTGLIVIAAHPGLDHEAERSEAVFEHVIVESVPLAEHGRARVHVEQDEKDVRAGSSRSGRGRRRPERTLEVPREWAPRDSASGAHPSDRILAAGSTTRKIPRPRVNRWKASSGCPRRRSHVRKPAVTAMPTTTSSQWDRDSRPVGGARL